MIHLDTNYLIGITRFQSPLAGQVRNWIISGEEISTSAIAWSEFMTGPFVTEQLNRVENLLGGRIIPFGSSEAECAAELYNHAGRKREKRIDSFIAATAIFAKAKLATKNRKDFE